MSYELPLTEANRRMLDDAFQANKRVDYSIDCVIEGQMGRAFVDDLAQPTAYRIMVGPFWYFAGDADSPGGQQMMAELPPFSLLMPSPPQWLDAAQKLYGPKLETLMRYSFSAAELTSQTLTSILERSKHRDHIVPLGVELATRLANQSESYLEIGDFKSIEDFARRGIGYAAMDGDRIMGVAYSSLVCHTGIEVSIYVEERYRQRGVATALGAQLLIESLQRQLIPNWDAANLESYKLARRLGFTFTGTYEAYYRR